MIKIEMIKEILQWGQKSEYERKIIGEENRNYIIKNFSSEAIGEKYLHLISNLQLVCPLEVLLLYVKRKLTQLLYCLIIHLCRQH